ncbi:MAG: DUF4835 family protein [Calditrichaeota bacterium]|nr:DUF4835 family protein [Calditrichota bacterium]
MKTLLMIFLSSGYLFSQVLSVTVSVEYDHLPDDEQEMLTNLAEKIEQYYNSYDWVDDEYETDVVCNIKVLVETVQKKTFEKIYKTQFLISSESGENFYDKIWEFPYEDSFPFSHSKGLFDPVTHFLDFYAYMILAGELDTYGLLLGSPLYDKALDIASQGVLSDYSRGWSNRNDELQKITHIRTRPLREAKPDFFEALYLYEEGKYNQAYKYAQNVFTAIKKVYTTQPNNRYLRIFFEAHYKQLAMLFSGKFEELEALADYDSKHRETYRSYLPKN